MARLKKINVLSLAKLQAVILAIAGLIAGILYSFGGFIIDVLVSIGWVSPVTASTPGLSFGTVLAFGALIVMPVLAAIVGFLAGAIGAYLYNIFGRWFGGMDLDFWQ
jgi:hypothetical protein